MIPHRRRLNGSVLCRRARAVTHIHWGTLETCIVEQPLVSVRYGGYEWLTVERPCSCGLMPYTEPRRIEGE